MASPRRTRASRTRPRPPPRRAGERPTPPPPPPATTKPEATETAEGSVLGVRASSGCLPAPQKLQSHGIGRLRLGRRPSETLLRNSRPVTGHPGLVAWCVSGNGRVVAALAKNGTVRFIASTATSSKARGIAPGSSTRRLAHKGLRKLARDLFVTRRGTKAVIGIAGKHVQFVGVADRGLLTHARQLRLYAV